MISIQCRVFRAPFVSFEQCKRTLSWKSFASVDPWKLSANDVHSVKNLCGGVWSDYPSSDKIVDPMNGDHFINVPAVLPCDIDLYSKSLNDCSKSGLHNPLKNPERYNLYGSISARASARMRDPSVMEFFAKLIQRVAPKSLYQATGEVAVTQKFIENFSGDQVRFLARSFGVPGDHYGQMSQGYRWPYGPTAIITPFNFPLEIPMLQLLGSLYMGNKVLLKVDSKVSIVMEQGLRLLEECGLPLTDVDFINCDGRTMHQLLLKANPRMTLFTGSSKVAELLARDLNGRLKIEDAGFDWKILGPDVADIDFVSFTSDQDSYAFSGQKCSAQSILFMHENWANANFLEKLKYLAGRRNLTDLTICPVLSITNESFEDHVRALLKIEGAEICFGGKVLKNTSIPSCYGCWEPTAIKIPLHQLLLPCNFSVCTKEIFGPFQIIVEYKDDDLDLVLKALEMMDAHLTAAVVSNDVAFRNKVLAHTINGTTYCGRRARTTGAPQNHWFGPAGDPRAAGIGSPEAIKLVWSCHREIIYDEQPVGKGWLLPAST